MSRDRFSLAWRSPRKMGSNKIGFENFPCLNVTNLRKNQFYTRLSHVEHSDLVFWEADKRFSRNTQFNWGFRCFPTIWNTLIFGAGSGQTGFLALSNFKCPFLKNEEWYQKFGRPLFGTHSLVYISKLSFPETPETAIGGIKSEEVSQNLAFR